MFYPDKPTVPRQFPDGLERELGGPKALPVGAEILLSVTSSDIADLFCKARNIGEEL